MIVRLALLLALAALPLLSFAGAANAEDEPGKTVLDYKADDIDGKSVDLSKYKGKVLLIVNTASQCGYTPQYKGLEEVYEKYKDQGFEVLAFPANDFGAQEPGSNDEIKEFCSSEYKTTFPLFSKITVKGQKKHPLYQYLTSEKTNPKYAGEIPWNFTKFLVGPDGQVIARFEPKDKPESPEVTKAIESALESEKK